MALAEAKKAHHEHAERERRVYPVD
jgi:hypothetical protein